MGRLARTYRRSNMPLYLQVASTLRRRIETGHWAPGARISTIEALAPDGLIEAFSVEQARSFALGVQWHPEFLLFLPRQRRLFQALLAAAQESL